MDRQTDRGNTIWPFHHFSNGVGEGGGGGQEKSALSGAMSVRKRSTIKQITHKERNNNYDGMTIKGWVKVEDKILH